MYIINGQEYESYEDYCEEITAYIWCQSEVFDFGEGEVIMSESGGEHATYKFNILHYLNTFDNEEYVDWLYKAYKLSSYAKLEHEFDSYYYEKLNKKLHNKYNRNMDWRNKILFNAKYSRHKYIRYPYFTKFDTNGNEYLVHSNIKTKRIGLF